LNFKLNSIGDTALSEGGSSTDTIVTARKVSIGGIVLALLMLLFIFRPIIEGFNYVAEWKFESALLLACAVVLSMTGCTTFVSALWLLWSRGHNHRALAVGGSAIITSGIFFATAAATHVLPCSGPS
jgi:hypothetical protein